LAFAGGGFGFFVAYLGLNVLRVSIASFVPAICPIRLDVSVLGFTLVVSLLSSVVGLLPALEATRLDLNKALKPGSPGQIDHLHGPRLRDILVVSEVTLAMVLFIGAGLLTKSFIRLHSVNLGFQTEGVLTAQMNLPRSKYPYGQPRVTFFEQFIERIQALPGVQSVAVGDHLPMTGYARLFGLEIEGRQASNLSTNDRVSVVMVSPEYFRSLGIPLLQGRFFNSGDAADSLNVALVNETLFRHYFPKENPIGQRVKVNLSCTIVGVVGDARQGGLDRDVLPQIYLPHTKYPLGSSAKLVIRAVDNPLRLIGPMRDVLRDIDGDVAASDIMTMEQRLAKSIASRRVNMLLTGAFAGLALLLAVAGVYGVMSYLVSQRTHEFGVRMALGGQRRDVLRIVMKQGFCLSLIGVVIGSVVALASTRVISSFLYNVSPTDPVTFVCVSLFLIGVALLASYIPARRAAKIDPMVALRYE
jgi:putative ABC transport system permease protein